MPAYDARTLGQLAYQAYAVATGGKTFDGRDMPTWDGLGQQIQEAWTAAAAEVASRHEQTLLAAEEPMRGQGQPPSIGQIVHYALSQADADAINKRRADFTAFTDTLAGPVDPGHRGATGHVAHVGNHAAAGQVYPAMVVRTFGGPAANLQVHLDGTDTYWATSRTEGDGEGHWAWPPRV